MISIGSDVVIGCLDEDDDEYLDDYEDSDHQSKLITASKRRVN